MRFLDTSARHIRLAMLVVAGFIPSAAGNALDDYIAEPDPCYRWRKELKSRAKCLK